jgi:hypothetical protein
MAYATGTTHRRKVDVLSRIWSTNEGLTALLVLLLVHLFVLFPLTAHVEGGRLLLDVVFSLILISGTTAVSRKRWTVWAVTAFAVASLVLQWSYKVTHNPNLIPWMAGAALLYCALLATVVFAQIARGHEVTSHHIQGAIAGFLLLALAWAFAYRLVLFFDPAALVIDHPSEVKGADAVTGELVYFSFVTLTTVGYGDITAVSPIARSLVILEALTGQLFPAVLLARLVSLEIYHRMRKQ